jgi:carbonic anhydrase
MVNLKSKRDQFIQGLVEAGGWEKQAAEEHFRQSAPMFEIGSEIEFVRSETVRLRSRYPSVIVAPLLYRVEDNLLYFVRDD